MNTFTPVDHATGPATDLLEQVQKALRLTPHMTKVMANGPALLQGYLSSSGALNAGVLAGGIRERLANVENDWPVVVPAPNAA